MIVTRSAARNQGTLNFAKKGGADPACSACAKEGGADPVSGIIILCTCKSSQINCIQLCPKAANRDSVCMMLSCRSSMEFYVLPILTLQIPRTHARCTHTHTQQVSHLLVKILSISKITSLSS